MDGSGTRGNERSSDGAKARAVSGAWFYWLHLCLFLSVYVLFLISKFKSSASHSRFHFNDTLICSQDSKIIETNCHFFMTRLFLPPPLRCNLEGTPRVDLSSLFGDKRRKYLRPSTVAVTSNVCPHSASLAVSHYSDGQDLGPFTARSSSLCSNKHAACSRVTCGRSSEPIFVRSKTC